ncbi:hypothetical protein D3C72_1788400 [compost metagenome]
MWELQNPWWEYVLRSLIVYAVVFVLLRTFGKKQLGQMGPFDFVLLLILSESISSGISGGDNSLGAAIICVTTFVIANRILDILCFKSKAIEKLLDGKPKEIIRNGIVNQELCRKEYISSDELASSLRGRDYGSVKDVRQATLETNGKITIIKEPIELEK